MVLLKEIEALYDQFADEVYAPRHLDKKTKELIAFSNSIMIDCKHCMKWHLREALEAGASQEEIAEVVALTMSVSAGKMRGIARETIEGFQSDSN